MKLVRFIERVHIVLSSLAGVTTLVMVATILPDVIGRSFFGTSFDGVAELNVALLVVLVFLGLAGTQAQDGHFRLSLIDALLGEGRALRIIRIVCTTISIGLFGLISWGAAKSAQASTLRGEFQFGNVGFPVWPMRICIAVGFILLTVQLCLDLYRLVTGRPRSSSAQPVDGH